MRIVNPHKTIKNLLNRLLKRKRVPENVLTEDDMDHLGTELVDELGPIPTDEEDATFGLKGKGYHKPEEEDGI